MRVALFGGSFDPIHRGHLRVATAAADAFRLDRVLFAPAGRQPLKPEGSSASFADRLAMVRLATGEGSGSAGAGAQGSDGRFAASDLDAPREDGAPNYTVDSLRKLAAQFPGADMFALIGADGFLDLPRWRSPEELLRLAEWIVVSRPGAPQLDSGFLERPELASLGLTQAQGSRVHLLGNVHEDVSATELRRRLGRGEACVDLLPAAVAAYIEAHQLYR